METLAHKELMALVVPRRQDVTQSASTLPQQDAPDLDERDGPRVIVRAPTISNSLSTNISQHHQVSEHNN